MVQTFCSILTRGENILTQLEKIGAYILRITHVSRYYVNKIRCFSIKLFSFVIILLKSY